MKKLIFCFDGTCNSPSDTEENITADASISNILKLHLLFGGKLKSKPQKTSRISINNEPIQHSFYYSGVGTRGHWFKRLINAVFAPVYGEMDDILAEANEDLTEHYKPDDEIYIVGFSRGAAIARIFAARLTLPVKFLGVFDTVAATKGSLDLDPNTFPASGIIFENDILSDHVEQAVHLLALDEERLAFQPTLFNKDERIQEVWFAGSHSDIGGGYWFDGLSDISLQFMLESLKGKLAILSPNNISCIEQTSNNLEGEISSGELQISPLVTGKLHAQQRRFSKIFTLSPRKVRVNINNDKVGSAYLPIIHRSVAERYKQIDYYRPETLKNIEYQCINKDNSLSNPLKGFHGLSIREHFVSFE